MVNFFPANWMKKGRHASKEKERRKRDLCECDATCSTQVREPISTWLSAWYRLRLCDNIVSHLPAHVELVRRKLKPPVRRLSRGEME